MDNFTKEHEALLPEYCNKWTNVVLSTNTVKPLDKQRAIEAVHLLYRCSDPPLLPPKHVFFFRNPLEGAIAAALIEADAVGNNWGMRAADPTESTASLQSVLNMSIKPKYDKAQETGDLIPYRSYFQNACHGSLEGHWLCYYDYCRHVLGVDGLEMLDGLNAVATECGFVWPFEHVAIVVPKPNYIRLKGDNLHAEGQPAIEYEDFGIYAYEGVALPKHIGSLHPSEWRAEFVLESDRADLRALLVSGMGPKRFVEQLGATCVSHSYHPVQHPYKGQMTQLIELYEPDWSKFNPNNKFKILHLMCPSTGTDHWHWVHHAAKDTIDAYQRMWGCTPEDWALQA